MDFKVFLGEFSGKGIITKDLESSIMNSISVLQTVVHVICHPNHERVCNYFCADSGGGSRVVVKIESFPLCSWCYCLLPTDV